MCIFLLRVEDLLVSHLCFVIDVPCLLFVAIVRKLRKTPDGARIVPRPVYLCIPSFFRLGLRIWIVMHFTQVLKNAIILI